VSGHGLWPTDDGLKGDLLLGWFWGAGCGLAIVTVHCAEDVARQEVVDKVVEGEIWLLRLHHNCIVDLHHAPLEVRQSRKVERQ